MKMAQEHLDFQEKINTGTAWTLNDEFDKNGYIVLRNLCDANDLISPVPQNRGQYTYYDKNIENFTLEPVESQVEGSTSRYWHPQYRKIHNDIRLRLQKEIGRLLYNTYYYDRFYFPGQKLDKHADRDACEISVTVNVGTNLKDKDADWPIYIKTPDTYKDKNKATIIIPGKEHSVILNPGDAMVYKGCERPHWREPMPGTPRPPKRGRRLFGGPQSEEQYYHQIFFHYVLQDGERAHCAWDRSR
jgi:hypothetical protein